ncbi:MAG: spike glycoprotein [Tadarida brasiliensis bat alphacoronavirus 1]|nr:MAG: spike glycoprotein [Tadarida brasiliensis bat alphacoronavirus 1]
MKLIILAWCITTCAALTDPAPFVNTTCATSITDFSYLVLGLPPNAHNAIVTGYFPLNQTSAWRCGHGNSFANGSHGAFISHQTHNRAFAIGVGTIDAKGWQMQINKYQQELNIRVCKYSRPVITDFVWGIEPTYCLYHYNNKGQAGLKDNVMVGVTWDNDIVTVYWHLYIHKIYVPGASKWTHAVVHTERNFSEFAHQFVYDRRTFFVSTNALGNITHYQVCNNCVGYAENIFSNTEGGQIPADFTPHNWFLLTNHSSVVHGTVVSNQPLRILCLRPIPVGVAAEGVLAFSEINTTLCNGYALNGTADAIRFNLNYTDNPFEHASNESVVINTDLGRFTFICGNSSEPSDSTFFPFGKQTTPFYCFLNSTLVNKPVFLGVLPRVLREFVFTKWGSVYINGYNYFQLPPINNITFNLYSKNNTGFWTVAYTQFADVLLQVNGTDITRVLYCDSDIERLKCAQKSFSLGNGFYNAATIKKKRWPETTVVLPFNFDHVNVSVNVRDGRLDINNVSFYCVNASQFTTLLNYSTDRGDYGAVSQHSGNCPFTLEKLNSYVTFNRLCFSTTAFADSCRMYFQYKYSFIHMYAFTLYVSYAYGDRIMGVPAADIGIKDISHVVMDNCTDYNIYGMQGTGVVSLTNYSFIGGLYYTSESGTLLGFKNVSSDEVYSVRPCTYTEQLAVINDKLVGVLTADNDTVFGFNKTVVMPTFYYHTSGESNCTKPLITYSNFGVCADGSITFLEAADGPADIIPIQYGNVSIPLNFTIAVNIEYIQHSNRPVVVDCRTYVCNGNPRCNKLLSQYAQACLNIENALHMSARIESADINEQISVNKQALSLATLSTFNSSGYNFGPVLPILDKDQHYKRSKIEDILFNKVVTSGLGTVDQDYKSCSRGLSIADLVCAQYYNGIMVLPGVVDPEKMAMYTGSLLGGMALGGLTAVASAPFSVAVQARLNYVALQTDVLQNNQKQLASAFNSAIGNITKAFSVVGSAIEQTSHSLVTVANALNKVQDVVNTQGTALTQLTEQLQNNFQAISASIQTIYNRLDELSADAQVDRLITGRLAALNAFVAQTLNRYTEVKASRALAFEKINECVRSQSSRFGFCGNGTHLFSIVNSAPEGFIFFHTVLVPSSHVVIRAFAGFCYESRAFVLHDVKLLLFHGNNTHYQLTPRTMFQPRTPMPGDFVEIVSCTVEHVNITAGDIQNIFPDYIDVNATVNDILSKIPNWTVPQFPLDIFNQTYLNLSGEIADLEQRSESLKNYTIDLRHLIDSLNKTLVDLEWLNRIETYVKWPWWVWLVIVICLIFTIALLAFCCLTTGCCGCCGCLAGCLSGCCNSTKLKSYTELEKLHIQ